MRDWHNIRIFLSVCRHGSLAGAARALKVDETTVGRRLKALEASLGTLLFDRTANGLILTEAAMAVRVAAEAAEDAVLNVQGSVVGSDTRPSGFVRITATETLSSQFIIPALGGFHLRYPEIRIELFSGYVALDIGRGEADIAVRALPPVGSHLVARVNAEWTVPTCAEVKFLSWRDAVISRRRDLGPHFWVADRGGAAAVPRLAS